MGASAVVTCRVLRVLGASSALGHVRALVSLLELDLGGLILLTLVVFEQVHTADTSVGH